MKTIYKAAVLCIITILTMSWTTHEGLAAETENPASASSSSIPIDDSSDNIDIQSTQYIMSGYSSLELLSSTTVRVRGETKAYIPVNSIRVELYLQQWNASQSQWVDVLSVGSADDYSSSSVSHSMGAKVVSGYYYRTKAQHRVVHNGVIEQFTSTSSYIYAE